FLLDAFPAVADGIFHAVPGAGAAAFPVAPRVGLDGVPVAAGVALVAAQLRAVLIGRGALFIGHAGIGISGLKVTLEIVIVFAAMAADGLNFNVLAADCVADGFGAVAFFLADHHFFDDASGLLHDRLLAMLAHLEGLAFLGGEIGR